MFKTIYLFLYLLLFSSNLFSITNEDNFKHKFIWNLTKDKRIESVKTADVEFYRNGVLSRKYEERNIIDLTAYAEAPKGGFRVQGVFKVFRREEGEELFRLEEKYDTDFIINTNGRYTVTSQYFMPNVRHVPTFPETDIALGESWVADSEELIKASDNVNITMQLSPEYTFNRLVIDDNGNTNAIIDYNIVIDKDLFQAGIKGIDYPERIYGFNYGQYEWDIKLNIPVSQSEKYQVLFGYGRDHNYSSLQYKMNLESTYKIYDTVTLDEADDMQEKMAEELYNNNGIEVDTVPEGLVLRLGEILFDVNSNRLRDDAKHSLDAAIDAIKKYYPDREIIVEGHTDITGDAEYNQDLSEKRSKTVADYIAPNLEHDKLSYKGYGSTKPVTSNRTPSERQKNRRVDIIIKLR